MPGTVYQDEDSGNPFKGDIGDIECKGDGGGVERLERPAGEDERDGRHAPYAEPFRDDSGFRDEEVEYQGAEPEGDHCYCAGEVP